MNWRTFAATFGLMLLLLAAPVRIVAQNEETEETPRPKKETPFVVVNFAGVERILDDVDYAFSTIDRGDIAAQIQGLLATARDLKGLDRKRPFGLTLFLGEGFPPKPIPVWYIPVDDFEEIQQTIGVGGGQLQPVAEKPSLYKLVNLGDLPDAYVSHQGNWLFVAENELDVDREFFDPANLAKPLTNRYDVAASLNLKTVPEAARTAFLFYLRASAEAELQQRDDEPDSQYELRKASGQRVLELFEQFLTQGEDVTIGLNVSERNRAVTYEIALNAKKDSKFAEYLKEIGGKRSYFARLLDGTAPLTVSASWNLDKAGRKILLAALDVGNMRAGAQLARNLDDPTTPAKGVFESLKATADTGHVDVFVQMRGKPPEKFVLVGGAKVEKSGVLADSMVQVLQRLQEKDDPALSELVLNIDSHEGIKFHRIKGPDTSGQNRRLYGDDASLYIGAGAGAVWFAVGGPRALDALHDVVDTVIEPRIPGENKDPSAPFQLVMNLSTWLEMTASSDAEAAQRAAQNEVLRLQREKTSDDDAEPAAPVGANERRRARRNRFRELAADAFAPGGDKLRLEVKPTDTGAHLRVTLDEGFVRLLALAISSRVDERQSR